MLALFPEGSKKPPSWAKAEIWTDWVSFTALAERLGDLVGALESAADKNFPAGASSHMMDRISRMLGPGSSAMPGGAEMQPDTERLGAMPPVGAFAHITQTCGACHKDFREKKE
ncbi:MAG: cytochrome c [Rhodospirillaceae bacterium]